jgi:hypothetical protein
MLWLVSVRARQIVIDVSFDGDGIGGEPVNRGSVQAVAGLIGIAHGA